MARIYPERLPESVLQDPRRAAERRVYTLLSELPSTFTVFYSVAWLSRASDGVFDGEADFVVAHPDLGILVLEVKGGGIAFNAQLGEWTSIDRDGAIHSIKDPVEQARKSKHNLLKSLQSLPQWSSRWLTMGHAVVFPDVDTQRQRLRSDLPPQIVIDQAGLADLEDRIRQIFAFYQREDRRAGPLGQDRLDLTVELLARSFQLRTPLGVELAYEDERIIELTQQQMNILDYLTHHRRASIQGCAGSGKTMLAVEKARRLADQGFDVLLTCFNVALAEHLSTAMPENVTVMNFHGLCEYLIKEAQIRAIPPQDTRIYYDQFLPEQLLYAIQEIGPLFDAIIVDEGQDFVDEWWFGLSSLLRDEKYGIFYIFFDDNQNLYRGADRLPGLIDQAPFVLNENCRNTASIHQLVAQFHPQGSVIRCRSPLGRAAEWVAYDSPQAMLRSIRQTLHRLINEEGIHFSDLVILTPRAERRSDLTEGLSLGNFTLTRRQSRRTTEIPVRTVHSFKGLDCRVVLLAEVDPFANRELTPVLYVGCSRARTHLLIFHDQRLNPESISVCAMREESR
jgi:hypothetical protein